ncbi:uncharacterized protein LOC129336002 [Eublepharis macularius]|uniref:Uncharacterized protein LOC129336002 n=1 Tax=Eublepharis macularius TaxID=481883 RepID=A0AA97L7U1_EUBMA|nr:uncharacterized protein LOC129336002 [Eublepharis macularius]
MYWQKFKCMQPEQPGDDPDARFDRPECVRFLVQGLDDYEVDWEVFSEIVKAAHTEVYPECCPYCEEIADWQKCGCLRCEEEETAEGAKSIRGDEPVTDQKVEPIYEEMQSVHGIQERPEVHEEDVTVPGLLKQKVSQCIQTLYPNMAELNYVAVAEEVKENKFDPDCCRFCNHIAYCQEVPYDEDDEGARADCEDSGDEPEDAVPIEVGEIDPTLDVSDSAKATDPVKEGVKPRIQYLVPDPTDVLIECALLDEVLARGPVGDGPVSFEYEHPPKPRVGKKLKKRRPKTDYCSDTCCDSDYVDDSDRPRLDFCHYSCCNSSDEWSLTETDDNSDIESENVEQGVQTDGVAPKVPPVPTLLNEETMWGPAGDSIESSKDEHYPQPSVGKKLKKRRPLLSYCYENCCYSNSSDDEWRPYAPYCNLSCCKSSDEWSITETDDSDFEPLGTPGGRKGDPELRADGAAPETMTREGN